MCLWGVCIHTTNNSCMHVSMGRCFEINRCTYPNHHLAINFPWQCLMFHSKLLCSYLFPFFTVFWCSGLQLPAEGLHCEDEINVSVDLVAPQSPGRYVSHWRLRAPTGQKFGQRIWVLIQVTSMWSLPYICFAMFRVTALCVISFALLWIAKSTPPPNLLAFE